MPNAADNPLGLRIPEQSAPDGDVLTRAKDVEEWVQRLPMASATATAKLLFKAIQDINRTELVAAARIQIAELLTPPINYAIGALERKYVDVGLPLSDKARRTALVSARLSEELAFAYKIVVRDVALAKIGYQERKMLIIALFRAVRHLSDLVYRSALIYDPFPRQIWRELHNLFVFAETNKWSSTKVKYQMEVEKNVSTLRDLYVQTLLFAAASPHRLRQREIRTLYRWLPRWSHLAQLEPAAHLPESSTRFVIQLKQDIPPKHAKMLEQPYAKPALELDTRKLIQSLRDTFDELPSETMGFTPAGGQEELSKSMVRRLVQSWGATPKRQFVRTRLNFDLHVAVGLHTVYKLIAGDPPGGQDIASFGAEILGDDRTDLSQISLESTFSSDLLDTESGLTLLPMEGSDGMYLSGQDRFGVVTQKEAAPAPSIWDGTQPAPSTPEGPADTTTLRTLNESAGGYCIQWQGANTPDAFIGELIGIQAPNDASQYGIAVVRWMQNQPESGFQVGLQLIANSALEVTATSSDRRQRTPTQCLLIPELKTADRPASLVAPVQPFKVGDSLLVRHKDTEQQVRLVRLLESTGAFAQFQFEYT